MNPYTILGVAESASPAEITAAYRRAARKHHPDAGGDAQKFKQVQLAYEILSDPERRNRYDQTGDVGDNARPTVTAAELLVIGMMPEAFIQNNVDPLQFIRRKLAVQRLESRGRAELLSKQSTRHAEKLERFRKKNDRGYDLIEGTLLSHLQSLTAEAEMHASQSKTVTEAIALLDKLECPPDNDRRTYASMTTPLSASPWLEPYWRGPHARQEPGSD